MCSQRSADRRAILPSPCPLRCRRAIADTPGRSFDGASIRPAPCPPHRRPGSAPTQPVVRPAGQRAPAVTPRGERPWTEPAAALAGPDTGACGSTGQASELQPGAQASGTGESPPPSGRSQREQHTQTTDERGDHRPGPQPQQAQAHAQPHQPQRRHTGTATGEPGAPPARYPTGSPTGSAHSTRDAARALLDPRRCPALPSPAAWWATTRPEERAAVRSAAVAARALCWPARAGPLRLGVGRVRGAGAAGPDRGHRACWPRWRDADARGNLSRLWCVRWVAPEPCREGAMTTSPGRGLSIRAGALLGAVAVLIAGCAAGGASGSGAARAGGAHDAIAAHRTAARSSGRRAWQCPAA